MADSQKSEDGLEGGSENKKSNNKYTHCCFTKII